MAAGMTSDPAEAVRCTSRLASHAPGRFHCHFTTMKTLSLLPALCAAILLAGCSSTAPTVGTGKHFRGPVGLQLYSLRAQFTRNVPESIKTVQGFGITEVELAGTYNLKPEAFRDMLTAAGLKPVSSHFSFDKIKNDPESIAAEAKMLGLKYAGTAWIKGRNDFTLADAHAAAEAFNRAGKVLAPHGIKIFYHCHGYEFRERDAQGRTAMDILIQETDPKYVTFEMDVLWVQFPGEDPAAWLDKYPGRWELMHLKDLKKGVATGIHTGGTDPNNDVVLGTGQMDWPKILRAAKKCGVRHYFIEDESAWSVEHIPQTLKFLESVAW
jgi:sugar phosphate isomerase/epimerase